MNERLDPEEVRGILGRIKGEAVRIVESHGGIVNQFVGDEVVALFGIPTAHEDDPVRAVRAARDLHALVRAMSPEVEGRIGAPLRLHTGISTGLIVTGNEDRRDGTFGITGDAVLVSEETQRLIADFFQVEPLVPVELKGKSGRVTPYRVIEQTGVSSRFEAAAQRGFTAYAGRETELRILHDALDKARAGQGQFITVMGEPGIGKSRLLFEFRHGVPRDQATVLTGHCQSYGTGTPSCPWWTRSGAGSGWRRPAAPMRCTTTWSRRCARSRRRWSATCRNISTCSRSRARRTRFRQTRRATPCAAPSRRPSPPSSPRTRGASPWP
jgi:hypothetical protein